MVLPYCIRSGSVTDRRLVVCAYGTMKASECSAAGQSRLKTSVSGPFNETGSKKVDKFKKSIIMHPRGVNAGSFWICNHRHTYEHDRR